MKQFWRFGIVGCIGFVVDAGVLHLLVVLTTLNLYAGRVISFVLAASTTWLLNRSYTFAAPDRGSPDEWMRYVRLMLAGAAVNYGTYALVISQLAMARESPWLGVAAGSCTGLLFNFLAARRMYGRQGSDRAQQASG